jgi:dTDP-4-amino-4,6-dideoxygalactose transaminase
MPALTPPAPTAASGSSIAFAPPDVSSAEVEAVEAVLRSGWLTTGPRVAEFEAAFAVAVGAPHAVALGSCTAALHLSLVATGIGPGDEVVTTPLTFCATANVILHCGATPVFADVDPVTGNLDAERAARAMTARTRALLPVHYAGHPVDMGRFDALARTSGAWLIDDAAHGLGAVDAGRPVGASGDLTCFSFYATKNLTTGEGGMVTTKHAGLAARIRVASRHGLSEDAWTRDAGGGRRAYDVTMAGFKCNMTDLQAAMGLVQLRRFAEMQQRRERLWTRYDDALQGLPVARPPAVPPGSVHARHLYAIRVRRDTCGVSRDELQTRLRARGIATSVHFPTVHLHTVYRQRFGFRPGQFPAAEAVAAETLSLPFSSALDVADVDLVVEALRDALV